MTYEEDDDMFEWLQEALREIDDDVWAMMRSVHCAIGSLKGRLTELCEEIPTWGDVPAGEEVMEDG